MGFFSDVISCILHFDKHLGFIIEHMGLWTYLLLFLVIFAETGLVVTPFLPGDSLLFVVGAFSARGSFNPVLVFTALAAAAITGDSLNYAIGKYFGARLSAAKHAPFFKKEYLERTHKFYEKYGGKTIVLARFVPVVRTFAPFVAGIGTMKYSHFISYNIFGGVLWVGLFVFSGFYFGNIPLVKENFSSVILVIIFLSILPVVIEVLKTRKSKGRIYG